MEHTISVFLGDCYGLLWIAMIKLLGPSCLPFTSRRIEPVKQKAKNFEADVDTTWTCDTTSALFYRRLLSNLNTSGRFSSVIVVPDILTKRMQKLSTSSPHRPHHNPGPHFSPKPNVFFVVRSTLTALFIVLFFFFFFLKKFRSY